MRAGVTGGPGATVGGRADIIGMPAVLDPLVDIAMRVIHAERIGREAADRCRIGEAIARPVGVGMLADLILALLVEGEREGAGGAGATGVLAFGFADHAVGLAGFLREPADVAACFLPGHADCRLARALRVAGLAVLAQTARAVVAVGQHSVGFPGIGLPLPGGHMEATHGEGLGECHGVQRTFIVLFAQFVIGRAHHVAAGGQYDHFRAILAVLENLARYRRVGSEGFERKREATEGNQ